MPEVGRSLRQHPATVVLIVVNLAVFLVLTVAADLEEVLGLPSDPGTLAERPWTPLTVLFTSANVLHALVAVLVLAVVGREVEWLVGPWRLLSVYVLSGLAGSLAILSSAAVTDVDETSLGASAAFLGVLGAAAVLPASAVLEKLQLPKVLVVVLVVNAAGPLLGIGVWVSSLAHAAGLGVGLLYGWWCGRGAAPGAPADPTTPGRSVRQERSRPPRPQPS